MDGEGSVDGFSSPSSVKSLFDTRSVLFSDRESRSVSSVLFSDRESALSKASLERELDHLDRVEKELESKIDQATREYNDMQEDHENRKHAYVSYRDLRAIPQFSNQTVIAIKAPSETKLEVADPTEVSGCYHTFP